MFRCRQLQSRDFRNVYTVDINKPNSHSTQRDDEWQSLYDQVIRLRETHGYDTSYMVTASIVEWSKKKLQEYIDDHTELPREEEPKVPADRWEKRRDRVTAQASPKLDPFDQPMEPDYFVMCPRSILRNPDLSDLALRVYLILRDHARDKQDCYPKLETIASAIGRKSLTETREALSELEQHNLIRREVRKPAPTRYHLRSTPSIRAKSTNQRGTHRRRGG